MNKKIFSRGGISNYKNEDCVYLNDSFGFVLDGATGLIKEKITNSISDAKWYAKEMKNYFIKNLRSNKNLKEILKDGISLINKKYNQFDGAKKIKSLPSASIALFRKLNDKIEYFVLGDCELIIKTSDNKINLIKRNDLSNLDSKNIKKLKEFATNKKINVVDALPLIKENLIETRLSQNTDKGYWTLSNCKDAIDHGLYGTIDIKEVKQIIGLSDGFSQIYNVFHIYSFKQLANEIEKGLSLDEIYNKLYKAQESDKLCNKYPRFKIRDDASIFDYEIK